MEYDFEVGRGVVIPFCGLCNLIKVLHYMKPTSLGLKLVYNFNKVIFFLAVTYVRHS